MISSPCRHCSKKNQPKDECVAHCEKIQMAQAFIVAQGSSLGTRSEYSELDDVHAVIPGRSTSAAYQYI